jgi:HK97 family phage major capsid protein
MGLPVAENRDATVEEVRSISKLDDELTALDDLIARAEKREADTLNPPSAGVRSKPPGEAPAVGTPKKDQRPYSIVRAIQAAIANRPLDGLEAEVDQEVQNRARSAGRTFKGFAVPSSLNDPDLRSMMFPSVSPEAWERRDLTTTTGAGSIYTVPRGFIELLRAKLVVRRLGVNVMEDMHGNFALTRQNGTNTVQWVGEGASATPSNLTFDNVVFTPKLAIATTIYSKQFMMQSSISVEEKVNNDLARIMALEWDRVILNGSGGSQPLGILNNTTIQANSLAAGLPMGTNGGPLTYAKLVAMEGAVATANAEAGKLAYLTNINVRTVLKNTYVGTAGYPVFVWSKGAMPDEGELNGQRALVVNAPQIPNNGTKGTAAGICSSIIYGNWGDLTVANWNTGVDVIVDPYTGKRSGAVEITTEMAMDAHPEHEASFAIITDVTPS